MKNNTKSDRSILNHRLIADRVLCHADTLRSLPGDLFAASQLAREMIVERDMCEPEDCATYNTNRHLDALIAVSGAAALYLSGTLYDIVGESDSDLPTIEPPAPTPAVEVSPAEQREIWQRIAAQAAEELAKLDAAAQGEAATSNGGARPAVERLTVTLNQEAADALDKLAIDVGGLKYRNNVASSLILDRLVEMTEGKEGAE